MDCQKHLFQLHPDIHYLNNAYKGPLLRSAEEAGMQALLRGRNPSDMNEHDFFDEVEETKTLYGQLVNCEGSQVALISSTSYGFASILNNIASKKNGNVVTVKDEFPSAVFAAQKWCKQNDNQLIFVEPKTSDRNEIGKQWNKNIIEQINEKTSFVIISTVHWSNGVYFDLKAIGQKCQDCNAKLLVDGTQSVGSQPIDVQELKISALVTAAYKWLLGPYSLGFMYLDETFYDGTPLEESWMNRINAKNFSGLTSYEKNYKGNAGRFSMGESSNFILTPIAKAGLQQILNWTPKAIQEYDSKLTTPLFNHLKIQNNGNFSNHLFSLPVPEKCNKEKLQENIKKNKIIVSQRGKSIRVSVNVFNTSEDIDALIKVIEAS